MRTSICFCCCFKIWRCFKPKAGLVTHTIGIVGNLENNFQRHKLGLDILVKVNCNYVGNWFRVFHEQSTCYYTGYCVADREWNIGVSFICLIWHLGGSRRPLNTPPGCGNHLPTLLDNFRNLKKNWCFTIIFILPTYVISCMFRPK